MSLEVLENKNQKEVARPEGFEPPTPCSGGTCSIHLSYGRTIGLYHQLALRFLSNVFWPRLNAASNLLIASVRCSRRTLM